MIEPVPAATTEPAQAHQPAQEQPQPSGQYQEQGKHEPQPQPQAKPTATRSRIVKDAAYYREYRKRKANGGGGVVAVAQPKPAAAMAAQPERNHVQPAGERGALPVIREVSAAPARERDPKTGRFPSRVPVCSPCTMPQYVDALALMRQGETTATVLQRAGIECWAALNERGLDYDPSGWAAAVEAHKAARVARLADRAQAVIEQNQAAVVTTTSDGGGKQTRAEQRRTDPAMMAQLAALIDPDTHGRNAGRAAEAGGNRAPQVAIQIVMDSSAVRPPVINVSETVVTDSR